MQRYWQTYSRWLWLVALMVILGAAVGFLVSRVTTPVYRASLTLFVNQAQNPLSPDYNSALLSERLTRTYGELIKKRPILEAAIQKLNLDVSPNELAAQITVRAIRDTQLLELAVEHTDPALARDLANTIAETFIIQSREERLGQSNSREVIRQAIADLENNLVATATEIERRRQAGDSAEVARLQAVLSQQQLSHSQLLRSEQEMRLAEARSVDTIRVSEPAVLPTEPVRPKVLDNVLLAAAIGLLIGLGAAFVIQRLDNTVKTPQDVQRITDLPTLGTIMRSPQKKGSNAGLLHEVHSHSPIAEAYRMLRTNVDFAQVSRPVQTLMVTSSHPGEGKTTTLVNLAISMAESGRRVIAVDSDLRRPTVHKVLGITNTVGLTNLLLTDNPDLGGALQSTHVPDLRVIPSGPIPPNPTELLRSSRMARLLERLRAEADLVLLDSPPVLAVADPMVLGAQIDGVILVVDAGVTRVQALAAAKEQLTRSSAQLLGVVLNKLSSTAGGYYYYHYTSDK